MTISATDLFFIASERMIDDDSVLAGFGGGGRTGTTIVQDGISNNVFPDVMPSDRVSGVTQTRLIYPAVLSDDRDALSNGSVSVLDAPTDPAVEVCAFQVAGLTYRNPAEGPVDTSVGTFSGNAKKALDSGIRSNDAFLTAGTVSGGTPNIFNGAIAPPGVVVGDKVGFHSGVSYPGGVYIDWCTVTGISGSDVTVDKSLAALVGPSLKIFKYLPAHADAPKVSAATTLTAGVSASDTALPVAATDVKFRLAPLEKSLLGGLDRLVGLTHYWIFEPGDQVLVQHLSTPTTREVAVVDTVDHNGTVNLTAGLANAYPTGSKVTKLVDVGLLQAAVVGTPFSQQAWTRTWADAPVGPGVDGRYSGTIGLTNEGAIEDRWVVVFTTSTQFKLISERYGQIGSGNTATDFLPLNPMTSQPYFTLFASGWGSGWLVGNCFRFNTKAAAAGLWVHRCVSPSSPGGSDQAVLAIRGDIGA